MTKYFSESKTRNQGTEMQQRMISFFKNVAVVNSFEKRIRTFRRRYFKHQYCIRRIWKFEPKGWKIIAAKFILMQIDKRIFKVYRYLYRTIAGNLRFGSAIPHAHFDFTVKYFSHFSPAF